MKKLKKKNSNGEILHKLLVFVISGLILADLLGMRMLLASSTANIQVYLEINSSPFVQLCSDCDEDNDVPTFEVEGKTEEIVMTDFSIGDRPVIMNKALVLDNQAILYDPEPIFFGKVNATSTYAQLNLVENGKHITGKVQTDKDGNWLWQSPVKLTADRGQLFLSFSDKEDSASKDVYVSNFMIEDITSETIEINYVDDSIRKAGQQEVKSVEPKNKIYTSLNLINDKTELSTNQKVEFLFRAVSNEGENQVPDRVLFRVRKANGEIIEEKYASIENNLEVKEDFFISPKYIPGSYYVESVIITDDNIVSDYLNFEIVHKKMIPFLGVVPVDSYKTKVLLSLLMYILIIFFISLGYEMYTLKDISKTMKVGAKKLKGQIS